ncbi:type II toxin-antitoxin system VapC family toxin [Agromyces sp. GXS1127]|uniref:type II toxin-antitoxin system VapC family toxin n=1 Tax=Agromyces sp. GXS1127 TaxID=3424181 RepID=UPI003D3209C2
MARVIVLDASVVIAHLASHDAHHADATQFFREHPDEGFLLHAMTLTEVLVGPIRVGRGAVAQQHLGSLGIAEWSPGEGGAFRLARLRVETGLKLPDCCVLDAAMTTRHPLATFDDRLARAAAEVGVAVVDLS